MEIDVQVISHGGPSTQRLDPETAVRLARHANDCLARVPGDRCTPRPVRRVCSSVDLAPKAVANKSVVWPFVPNVPGTTWMHKLQLSAEDKAKILSGNARRLPKMSLGVSRQALVTSTGSGYTGAPQRWASTVGAATYSSLLEIHAWP